MRHLSATMTATNTLWMCVALAAAILAAFLVVVLGTPTKRAEAAFPGKNGKIAFVSDIHGDREIFTMKPNGDNQTALTNNIRVADFSPAFSANGKKIAFASERSGNLDIYTMSANGTDKKQVTTGTSPDFDPAWSPDGTRIAFTSTRNGNRDTYVINKDGTGLTRLTTSPQFDSSPTWSPDGTRIAFQRTICVEPTCDTLNYKIYVMKAARESQTNRSQRLTTSGSGVFEGAPAWSPDGTRIAFASAPNLPIQQSDIDLYSIRADGSDQIRLTTTSIGLAPAWSPDGTKIAFLGKRAGTKEPIQIHVMKAAPESEANRPKLITGTRGRILELDWQPLR